MPTDKTPKKRVVLRDLSVLGEELSKTDRHLVAVLQKRMQLASEVEEWKTLNGNQPLVRPEAEGERLHKIKKWAETKGINPDFAQALLYLVMAEACRTEIVSRQARTPETGNILEADRASWHGTLKANLLELTKACVSVYDEQYGDNAPFPVASYVAFENRAIKRIADGLKATGDADVAVDLGCATGRVSFLLASYHFRKVIGYDISPDMVAWAQAKNRIHRFSNVEFHGKDVSEGIPLPSESVSLVVMNLGTASDVPNLKVVMVEIGRILKRGGRFLLSFYNSAALIYHWFLPWIPSLFAEINPVKHCLDVSVNNRTFQVYARPYSVTEVKKLLAGRKLEIDTVEGHPSLKTYPTIAPILPDEFFRDADGAKKTVLEIDEMLSSQGRGAYILVTGKKP